MAIYQNIAGYRFAPLQDLTELRKQLLEKSLAGNLKGTILLSPEGINLFVAGIPPQIQAFLEFLRTLPGMSDLEVKFSESDHQPFRRMLVRLKKEIIAFGVEGIDPAHHTSPKLSPRALKAWLDEGRPVTLLDTRNDYEVKLGTFKNALPIGIDHFRDFPKAVEKLDPKLKSQPVVMFCTGGIRCEKAGPFMEREGFQSIFQLEGGILKYFEECGNAHYDGECFVFDQRVGVDPKLEETESIQCFSCLQPLTQEEQADPRYQPGRSCPYCFKSAEEAMRPILERRHEAIRRATTPLPGSLPYHNFRPISVPQECHGVTLLEALVAVARNIPKEEWISDGEKGLLLDSKYEPTALSKIVRAGERYYRKLPETVEPEVNAAIEILHEDEALVVINKPAPLPMHPGGRYNRNTLQSILLTVYPNERPRPAHRLDANTTGLVLVTRTRRYASQLQPQFESKTIDKRYLVRVQGVPSEDFFICEAPIAEMPSAVGAREIDLENGLASKTEFQVLQRHSDGTSLLEARPLTGRTNQIRLHLWHLGFPVCGDRVYLPGRILGDTQTLCLQDPPLCLHAWKISFRHPLHQALTTFSAPPPNWTNKSI